MKLVSLEFGRQGGETWTSGQLKFGDRVTQLFGENGCGKTPLVQSIVYALGYKVDFRDDIVERCDQVTLVVNVSGDDIAITRRIGGSFGVSVEKNGSRKEFINEREYSGYLLDLWGFDDPALTSVHNVATRMYSGQILPLYYLDQDHGYSIPYYSNSRFIKDQYAEAMRLVYGLASKNLFDRRREKVALGERLDYIDRTVARSEKIIAELLADIDGPRRSLSDIDLDLQASMDWLQNLRESGQIPERSVGVTDSRIDELQSRERSLAIERAELDSRVKGLLQIRHEIEVEADTLSLNEEARRVFASFDAICANENCGLFVRSSISYGKSLLYLKDQVKDLDRIRVSAQEKIDAIDRQLSVVEGDLAAARLDRASQPQDESVATLVQTVSYLTERVIDLRRAKQIEAELNGVESEYVSQLEQRAQVQNRLSNFEGPSGASDLELLKVRNELQERIRHWLKILRPSNVSYDVEVDTEFNVTFGGQKVSKFKGSTLTRIILAIRTGGFDVGCRSDGSGPQFFILDTPRQQDIAREDLEAYVRSLQSFAQERSVQIILSTTNHRYLLGEGDQEWVPGFPGDDHPMFLGVVGGEKLA